MSTAFIVAAIIYFKRLYVFFEFVDMEIPLLFSLYVTFPRFIRIFQFRFSKKEKNVPVSGPCDLHGRLKVTSTFDVGHT